MVHLWDQIFSAAPALSRSEGKLRQLTIPLHQWRVNAFCWSSESSFLLLMPRLWLFCWMSKSAHSAGGGGETLKAQFSQHPHAHFFFEDGCKQSMFFIPLSNTDVLKTQTQTNLSGYKHTSSHFISQVSPLVLLQLPFLSLYFWVQCRWHDTL